MRVTQFRWASWFVLGSSVTLSYSRGLCKTWMVILSGFESLPDAVSRFSLIFQGLVLLQRFSRTTHVAASAVSTPVFWVPEAF